MQRLQSLEDQHDKDVIYFGAIQNLLQKALDTSNTNSNMLAQVKVDAEEFGKITRQSVSKVSVESAAREQHLREVQPS